MQVSYQSYGSYQRIQRRTFADCGATDAGGGEPEASASAGCAIDGVAGSTAACGGGKGRKRRAADCGRAGDAARLGDAGAAGGGGDGGGRCAQSGAAPTGAAATG